MAKRYNKYGAHKTTIDGHTFDSAREAERYCELKVMAKAGVIKHLELQPSFPLQDGFECKGKKYRPIINLQDGKGYYRQTADEKSDVEACIRIQKSRMNKIREAMLGAINYIQDVSGQLSLFD